MKGKTSLVDNQDLSQTDSSNYADPIRHIHHAGELSSNDMVRTGVSLKGPTQAMEDEAGGSPMSNVIDTKAMVS